MNNNNHPNSVSGSVTTKSSALKWLPFRPSILQVLPTGTYNLHQKTYVTPAIPEVVLCSAEDQRLYSQVDEMERNFLDGAILRKIMDINKGKVKMVVSYNGMVAGARGQILHVLKNEFTGKKQEQMRNSLGDLMAMAYDMILVPVPLITDKQSPLRGCLQDHNYCPPQQSPVLTQPLATRIHATTSPGGTVQNYRRAR